MGRSFSLVFSSDFSHFHCLALGAAIQRWLSTAACSPILPCKSSGCSFGDGSMHWAPSCSAALQKEAHGFFWSAGGERSSELESEEQKHHLFSSLCLHFPPLPSPRRSWEDWTSPCFSVLKMIQAHPSQEKQDLALIAPIPRKVMPIIQQQRFQGNFDLLGQYLQLKSCNQTYSGLAPKQKGLSCSLWRRRKGLLIAWLSPAQHNGFRQNLPHARGSHLSTRHKIHVEALSCPEIAQHQTLPDYRAPRYNEELHSYRCQYPSSFVMTKENMWSCFLLVLLAEF